MTGRRVGGGAALVGLVALAMVSAACGNGGDTAREPNDPAGLPSAADPVFCDAYIDASSASTESTAGVERLAAALGGDTPAAVAVALETLATLGPSPSGTPDVFARDEAWGTVDRHVKPLCRVAWRRGVVGAGSPLETATAFVAALRDGDGDTLRTLAAANALAMLDGAVTDTVELGRVTAEGFDLLVADAAVPCVFHAGFVDDCHPKR